MCYNRITKTATRQKKDNRRYENGISEKLLYVRNFYRALRGEWISVKKIAEEYQVSTKTIGRYINEIQQFLSENRELMQNAELLYSHKEKAYYLHADDFWKIKSYSLL